MKLLVPVFVLALALTASGQQKPYTDQFVSVNGLRLHYLDWGNAGKPPLIMLHGIGRDAHSFDHIAPRFSNDYHVMAVDLRGHGDSAWHPDGAYLVEDLVKDLEGLVEQRGFRGLVLLGNSTGGRVVQVYAGLHPDRVRALIVEDVGPERPADIAAGFARRVQQEANGWSSEDELVAQLRAQDSKTSEELLRAHARSATKRRDDGRLVWKRDPNLVKGFVPTELWQYVRRITSPTLYVLGGRSTIVSAATQEQLKKTIPGCEIVVMPGLGHYPHLEAPTEYVELVKAFLSRRTAGR
jgi:pimeloyl-ACP methyl ester carboxylesterase